MVGESTTCKASDQKCPELRYFYHDGIGSSSSTRKSTMSQHIAPVYGEYVYYSDTISFSAGELSVANAYYTLVIEGPGELRKDN